MLSVYLSGEIHTNWREEIIQLCEKEKLKIKFSSPTTNHDASDNCGVEILGHEEKNFWKDNKGAKINSIKTKKSIKHDASLQQSIEIASKFVGESIPVVNKETKEMLGVVSEADLFQAYLLTQNKIIDLEKK